MCNLSSFAETVAAVRDLRAGGSGEVPDCIANGEFSCETVAGGALDLGNST